MQEKLEKEGFKELDTKAEFFNFEKEGDHIRGIYLGIEEPSGNITSPTLRLENPEGIKAIFITKVLVNKIKDNKVEAGDEIVIIYKGKKQTKDKKREYHDYSLYKKNI